MCEEKENTVTKKLNIMSSFFTAINVLPIFILLLITVFNGGEFHIYL